MPSRILERPRLNPHFVFRWEPSQNAHILLYPEGLIKLSPEAAEILSRCNGSRSIAEIIAELSAAFPAHCEAIAADTHAFIATASDKGWLRDA